MTASALRPAEVEEPPARPADRTTTAVHEAAHAVAALRTRTRFAEIRLEPPWDPVCLGSLERPDPPNARAFAVVICAGLLVDLRAGQPLQAHDRSDLAELLRLGPELAAETGQSAHDATVDAFAHADRLLRRHHGEVQRVAVALLAAGALSEDEVRAVVRARQEART